MPYLLLVGKRAPKTPLTPPHPPGHRGLQTQVLRRTDTHSLCPGGPPAPHKDTTCSARPRGVPQVLPGGDFPRVEAQSWVLGSKRDRGLAQRPRDLLGRVQPGQRAEVPRALQGAHETELSYRQPPPALSDGVRAEPCLIAPCGNEPRAG